MARIRSIKPEFFRHEGLQDLERDNPGAYVMLTFAGLWTQADRNGRFEWRPRTLKLDILPFLDFDLEKTLVLLQRFTVIRRYEVDGKHYGEIVNFLTHQRISGKEATDPGKYPEPIEYLDINSEGSNGEATGKQPVAQEREGKGKGKGREKEREGEGSSARFPEKHAAQKINGAETGAVWDAYSLAYRCRYGVDPVRNAKVNSQLKQVVQRLGIEEAPAVAAWYVQHNRSLYVAARHAVDLMLRDAEGLRTEWATGRTVTDTRARQIDATQTNANVFNELIEESRNAAK